MKLLGKKAIVTGANRHIGQAIAIALATEGADVVISYRSDEKGAQQTVESIEKAGRLGEAFYADFSQLENVTRFFNEAFDVLGSVDILVNNAGVYDTTEFLALDVHTFEHLLKINVTVPMLLTQLAMKRMVETGIAGKIINISAVFGNRPYSGRVAYSTTKAALNMLTENIAIEAAPYNIRVNAISPGDTPYDANGQEADLLAQKVPLKRVGRPEDYTSAAVYLASEDSSWMTGQILTIDGGQSLSF